MHGDQVEVHPKMHQVIEPIMQFNHPKMHFKIEYCRPKLGTLMTASMHKIHNYSTFCKGNSTFCKGLSMKDLHAKLTKGPMEFHLLQQDLTMLKTSNTNTFSLP